MALALAILPWFWWNHEAATSTPYRAQEIWKPVVITLKDATETPTLWCKTKIMTSVHLPLVKGDVIVEILTGDDEKLWQVGGEGTGIFSVKPAHHAEETTALVRTVQGQAFQFRLFNLAVPAPETLALDPEALVAYEAYVDQMNQHAPYIAVVLRLRQTTLGKGTQRLAEQERQLADEIATYQTKQQELKALETKLQQDAELRIREGQAQWVSDYAGLVDANYRVRYRAFSGGRQRYPIESVYNDGVFTWVRWKHAPILHVAEIKPDGREVVVNVIADQGLLRIDRVADVLAFRDQANGRWLIRLERRQP